MIEKVWLYKVAALLALIALLAASGDGVPLGEPPSPQAASKAISASRAATL